MTTSACARQRARATGPETSKLHWSSAQSAGRRYVTESSTSSQSGFCKDIPSSAVHSRLQPPQLPIAMFTEANHYYPNSSVPEPGVRHNNTQTSCEPCAKSNAPCSHGRPVGSGCHERGNAGRCRYDLAALTNTTSRQTQPQDQSSKSQQGAQMPASIDAACFHVRAREFDDSINRLGSMLSVSLPLHPQIEVLVQNYFRNSPSALVSVL